MSYILVIETSFEAGLKRTPATLIAILLFAPAIATGAEARDLSLSSLLATVRERGLGTGIMAQGPGAALAALAGGDTLPVPCGTPIVQALDRADTAAAPSLRQALTLLAGRPVIEGEQVAATRDGHFAIHYSDAAATFGLRAAGMDDFGAISALLAARQAAPGRALASDDLQLMQGAILWPLFLAERSGDPSIVRQIWTESGARGLDALAAADQVLRRSPGGSLAEAFREYTLWNLFTGERDDGRHYPSGRLLPGPSVAPLGAAIPINLDPVEPLGSVAFHLPGDHVRGCLDFEVRAEGGMPSVDLLISYRTESQGPVLVQVPLGPDGRGRASIPWSDAREAFILFRNGAPPGAAIARFELRGVRDPYAPVDLASLAADALGGSLVLRWTTASETDMIGWNVYRGGSPAGAVVTLHTVDAPGFGIPA